MCAAGEVAWGRLRAPAGNGNRPGGPIAPLASSPIALLPRTELELWRGTAPAPLAAAGNSTRGNPTAGSPTVNGWAAEPAPPGPVPPAEGLSAVAAQVRSCLATRGALFRDEVQRVTNLLPAQVDTALGELAAAGVVTCDSFAGLRALIRPAARPAAARRLERARRRQPGRGGAPVAVPRRPLSRSGRWSLLPPAAEPAETHLEAIALGLLHRYGVVFRRLLERETLAPAWRDLVVVYRLLEARGQIRGGYFVSGVGGEQFALAEAVAAMRRVRRAGPAGALRVLPAVDPAAAAGIKVRPAHERHRLAAVRGNRILFRDGVPVAVREAGETRFLDGAPPMPDGDRWSLADGRAAPVRNLIVTLGADGCLWVRRGGAGQVELLHQPARPATAVDTVGAGDCFCGVFAAALAAGAAIPAALRYASAAAALSVQQEGAQPSMPHRARIEALLAGGAAPETTA